MQATVQTRKQGIKSLKYCKKNICQLRILYPMKNILKVKGKQSLFKMYKRTKWKKLITKDHMLYEPTYMKWPKEKNLWRQKEDQWWPTAWRG